MTAEHLLEAMSLLDDDLIQEADMIPRRKPVNWRSWTSLAACAVLVVALGYGVTHLRMGGANTSAPGNTGTVESNTLSSAGSGDACWTGPEAGTVFLEGQVYSLTGEVADALPEDCQPLGVLSSLVPDAPSTDIEEYVGCELWQGPDGLLYVQLPDGGYAVAELVEP